MTENDEHILIEKQTIRFIQNTDSIYPKSLKKQTTLKRPMHLYHTGQLTNFENCITIVGTRNCSTYGSEMARNIAIKLTSNNFTIVSGLAKGIDSYAHRGAITNNGKTIAVLGWLNEIYPPEHKTLAEEIIKNGCIISEKLEKPKQYANYEFLKRNEIIVGMSNCVVVVESKYTSGTKYTAEYATKIKKPIIIIKPRDEHVDFIYGYEQFIKNGCISATNADEVLKIIHQEIKLQNQNLDSF